jgi:hypothetical protein
VVQTKAELGDPNSFSGSTAITNVVGGRNKVTNNATEGGTFAGVNGDRNSVDVAAGAGGVAFGVADGNDNTVKSAASAPDRVRSRVDRHRLRRP